MRRLSGFLILLWVLSGKCAGQVLPEPGAKLNFIQVMFDHPAVIGASQYVLQIKEDAPGASFDHPFIEQKDSAPATMVSYLQFGKKYLWRYAGIVNGALQSWQGPYNFETLDGDGITSGNGMQIKVLKNEPLKSGLGLITLDHACCIINGEGQLVWFMYGSTITTARIGAMRDMRVTPQGTITAIIRGKLAVEFDLRTRHLWQAPNTGRISGDSVEHFSHDFKKLPNGHYMVIDSKQVWEKVPDYFDTADAPKPASAQGQAPKNVIAIGPTMNSTEVQRMKIENHDGQLYARADIGVIVEYDQRGNPVWYWNSQKYITPEDLFVKKGQHRILDSEFGPHLNAFYYDTKNGYVYGGFRYISRIVKIDKTTGQVVNSWGEKTLSGEARQGDGFFNYQHDINMLRNGNLVVFDNETSSGKGKPARVVEFTDPAGSEPSKITWQYDCHFDSSENKSARGGNVEELDNGNLLVNTGATSRIFEVTRDKKIVWEALVDKKIDDTSIAPFPLYRTHYFSSLYPCYFTFQAGSDTIKSRSPFRIRIFNTGSESDSYRVKVVSQTKAFDGSFTTPAIGKKHSADFEIAPVSPATATEVVQIYVTSVTNPNFTRRAAVLYEP